MHFAVAIKKIGSHYNGNYLGLLELLAKFDPFIAEHITADANKGKGHTSYLSKTICEEFISLIGSSMHDSIICKLKNSKYYTISLDSTPDISNVDQLILIVRDVLPTGPVERFIIFLDMDSHSAEYLQDKLLLVLRLQFKHLRGLKEQYFLPQLITCQLLYQNAKLVMKS